MLGKLFRRRKRRRTKGEELVDRATSLASRPVRNRLVKWEENEDGHVVLHVPVRAMRRARGGKGSRLFPAPETRDVVLDEIGSGVWRRADGEHTTEDLLAWMRERWQFSWKEAELGLTSYLRTLAKRGFILILKPDTP
jgi:hypothetical protein